MRIRMSAALAAIGLTFIGVFAGGCGRPSGASAPAAVRTDSAGVTIVRSPGRDRPLGWTLKPLFTVGAADSGPESFFQVQGLGADSAGDLYVLDGGNKRVVVFGPKGHAVRTEGGPGQGPGELSHPVSLTVRPDGSVAVFDFGRRAFVGFDPSGEPVPDERVSLYVWGRARRTTDGFVASVRGTGAGDSITYRLLHVRGGDTTTLERIADPPPKGLVRFASCGVGFRGMPAIFQPDIRWSASPAGVAAAPGAAYAVDRFRGDALVASFRRDLPPRKATAELATRELGEGMRVSVGGQPVTCKASEVAEKLGFAPSVPAIKDLALAPDGTLWVERKVIGRTAHGPIDVLSPRGEYLGTLPAGTPLPGTFLPGDRIAAMSRDSMDVERVTEYRVVRKAS